MTVPKKQVPGISYLWACFCFSVPAVHQFPASQSCQPSVTDFLPVLYSRSIAIKRSSAASDDVCGCRWLRQCSSRTLQKDTGSAIHRSLTQAARQQLRDAGGSDGNRAHRRLAGIPVRPELFSRDVQHSMFDIAVHLHKRPA